MLHSFYQPWMMFKQRFKQFFKRCKMMAMGRTSSKSRIYQAFNIHNGTIIPREHRGHIFGTSRALILICIASSHCIRPRLLQLWIVSPTLEKAVPLIHTVGSPSISFNLKIHISLDRALLAEPLDRRGQASHNAIQRLDRRRHSAQSVSREFGLGRDIFESSRSSHFQNGRSIGRMPLATIY